MYPRKFRLFNNVLILLIVFGNFSITFAKSSEEIQLASVIDGETLIVDLDQNGLLDSLTETVKLIGVKAYPYIPFDTNYLDSSFRFEVLPKLRELSIQYDLSIDEIISRGRHARQLLEQQLEQTEYLHLQYDPEIRKTSSGIPLVYLRLSDHSDPVTLLLSKHVVLLSDEYTYHRLKEYSENFLN